VRTRSIAAVTLVSVLALSGMAHGQRSAAKAAHSGAPLPVADVIAQVKRELQAAQNTPGASAGLSLEKVEVNFALTKTTDASGKVSIGIPVLGGVEAGGSGRVKTEETSSVLVELVPPKPLGMMSGEDIADLGIARAIVETRRQLVAGLGQSPKLDPSKVVISLKFVATRTGGASGQIKFLVFTLGGGKELTSANSSGIVLTFTKSKELQ
jgi:hypothetical protein